MIVIEKKSEFVDNIKLFKMCRKCPFLGLTTKSSSCWGDSRSLPRTIESKRWADVVADSSFKCSARVWQRKFRIRDWISREYCRLRYPPPPPLHPGLPTSIVLLLVVVASPYVTKFHPFFAVRADKQEKYSHNSAMSPRSFGAPSHPGGAAEWTYKIVSPVAFVHLISSPLGSQFSVRYPVQPS